MMKTIKMNPFVLIAAMGALVLMTVASAFAGEFPAETWPVHTPEQAGLDSSALHKIAEYLGGRGFIARDGFQVFTWGDADRPGDVASAAKPFYSFFLLKALQDGLIPSLDQPVVEWEPRLAEIPHGEEITWRHLANQISCYGVEEAPGTAFDYNDWQMALFWDCLFRKVYGATLQNVDEKIFHPGLTDVIGCQDSPSMLAFGPDDRAGRLSISPRDFARFGLLFMHEGAWRGKSLLKPELARMAVTQPLPLSIPRASGGAASMIEGQRSIGSRSIPDNQCDHEGCYSWLWWLNGVGRDGKLRWPDAPVDVFTALGHENGMRGMAVLPSLGIVMSWNDTRLGEMPSHPHPLNEPLRLLVQATGLSPREANVMTSKPSSVNVAMAQIVCLDGDREGNFARIEHAIHEASQAGAQIVCFPETALLGWVNPDAHDRADPIPGPSSDRLCDLAKRYSVYLCVGLAEKDGDALYDSAILIDDRGRILSKHRKMNILNELMKPSYVPGREIVAVDTPLGRIGMLICADTFVDGNLARMAAQKPDLVLVPYGWAAPEEKWPGHGKELEKTVVNAAKRIGAPVVGTDVVGAISHGPWTGWVYGGQSIAASRDGKVLGVAADRDRDVKIITIYF
ncbi:MAG: serine hydrolase [bacterium]|nr:serine hydrolase [bacterium]